MNAQVGYGSLLMINSVVVMLLARRLRQKMTTTTKSTGISPSQRYVLTGREGLEIMLACSRNMVSPLIDRTLFMDWCRSSFLRRVSRNSEYIAKKKIRNIRRAHLSQLEEVEHSARDAFEVWKTSPSYTRFEDVESKFTGIRKAIESMEAALTAAQEESAKTKRIRETLLPSKKAELHDVESEYKALCNLPKYKNMLQRRQEMERVHESLGITTTEAALRATQIEVGAQKKAGGFKFEDVASNVIQRDLVDILASRHGIADLSRIVIARNITLGMASNQGSPGEIDIMVCVKWGPYSDEADGSSSGSTSRKKKKAGNPQQGFAVKVLGVVEVKKNADDLASAFRRYQIALNWLSGCEDSYDGSQWITSKHPSGHFRTPYYHVHSDSETLVFTKSSFSLLAKGWDTSPAFLKQYESDIESYLSSSPEHSVQTDSMLQLISTSYCKHLFFVTQHTSLDNVPSKLFNIILHRIATGTQFDDELSSDEAIEDLRRQLLRHEEEANLSICTSQLLKIFDILKLYDQVLVVCHD